MWVPEECKLVTYFFWTLGDTVHFTPSSETVFTFNSASLVINDQPNDELFTVTWPVGTQVNDEVAGETYSVGASDDAEQTPSDAADAAKQTDEFRGRDADGDERLSLEELLSRQPETAHARLRQRFATVDFDGLGRSRSGRIPQDFVAAGRARKHARPDRRSRADGREMAAGLRGGRRRRRRHAVEQGMALREDGIGGAGAGGPHVPGLGPRRQRNGDPGGGHWIARRRLWPAPSRWASAGTEDGLVLSWNYVRLLDTDRDGALSRDEFVPKYLLGAVKNAERFSELDADQDGRLDDDEMAPAFWRDTLGEFFGLDADGDGRLTTEDLFKFGYAEEIARRTVCACDDDGDGKLSFVEFRATTFENPTSDWFATRRDADNDGRLSFEGVLPRNAAAAGGPKPAYCSAVST